MNKARIPHSRPSLGEEEARAAYQTVMSGHIAQGPRVRAFEEELAGFFGVRSAVCVNSGSSALQAVLLAMGVRSGRKVLLPSYVCTAPLNAVYAAGGEPVLCDIEEDTFNIAPEEIISRSGDTARAVIVPHLFGSPADLEKIVELGIPVIEDCAHSAGAFYGDRRTGSIGACGILSFYANKMLACGEGGAVISNDAGLIEAVRDMRDYDQRDDYRLRFNYKMSDIQAAVGSVQLKKLDRMIEKRKELACEYDKALADTPYKLPRGEFDHIYYRYVVKCGGGPERPVAFMSSANIACARPVYKPLHRYLEIRSGYRKTDEVFSTAMSIPLYPGLDKKDQKRVIRALKSFVDK